MASESGSKVFSNTDKSRYGRTRVEDKEALFNAAYLKQTTLAL